MKELKQSLKTSPVMGAPLCSGILNTIARGARLKKLYMRSAPTGVGKCVKGDTLVYTDEGLIEIKDIPKYYNLEETKLQAGIVTYDLNTGQKLSLPTSHWYNMGREKTIKITTKMGYSIEGTFEHPVVVGNLLGDIYFKKLKDIKKDDKIIISLNNNQFGINSMSDNLSYLIGFLTGDGYLNTDNGIKKRNSLSYSKVDEATFEEVNKMIKEELIGVNGINTRVRIKGSSISHSFGTSKTIEYLQKDCGLSLTTSEYKQVPVKVMTGDKKTVVNFLQGLFDTDGSITGGMFEFSTASEKLAIQVHMLLLNFGIISKLRTKNVNSKNYYIIHICNYPMLKIFNDEIGFRLAQDKKMRLKSLVQTERLNSNSDYTYGKERLEYLHKYLKENIKGYTYNRKKFLNYICGGITFYESMKSGKRISRERIRRLFMNIGNNLPEELLYLKNISNNMFFDDIKSIEESECEVFDFTVPSIHSFVANGLINHNTRLSLGDAGNIASKEIFDTHEKKWIKNGVCEPTLFITTELEMDEVQTPLMAFVSGVDEDNILDGIYKDDEEKRVDRAIEVIENSPLWIEHLPNFDIDDIETTIQKYVLKHNVKYVFFDYVHVSMKLLQQLSQQSKGMKLREDNILLMFVDRLKAICNKLDVFIFTATQVTGEWKSVKDADQNLLRGAKAMADKIDLGIIAREPSKSDLEAIKPMLAQGFYPEPNLVYDVYKNRRNKLVRVKLWAYVDLGTCRTTDLFLTDADYKVIPVQSTKIEFEV
ncbi:hypothetical protein EEL31_08805 [Brevibacillus laterosporus]|nr:LAGLIDADG family homing endonuclease [Brevibacillus laterosporus]TPG68609.1 hypothetical protein EEL31_08805 [Brevibacillus laterosporus]